MYRTAPKSVSTRTVSSPRGGKPPRLHPGLRNRWGARARPLSVRTLPIWARAAASLSWACSAKNSPRRNLWSQACSVRNRTPMARTNFFTSQQASASPKSSPASSRTIWATRNVDLPLPIGGEAMVRGCSQARGGALASAASQTNPVSWRLLQRDAIGDRAVGCLHALHANLRPGLHHALVGGRDGDDRNAGVEDQFGLAAWELHLHVVAAADDGRAG